MAGHAVPALTLVGLLFTAVGAGITAWAVVLGTKEADELAATKWDRNIELRDALLHQSRSARIGLIIIVVGTLLQIAAVGLGMWQ